MTVPEDDSQFWNFKISYISFEKYVDPLSVDLTVLEDTNTVVTDVNNFWSMLVKFASFLTCVYSAILIFIIVHNFDEDDDFEKRKRAEMALKI